MSRRSGIMLCYPFEEKRLAKWGFPVLVQPKLDGDRCRAIPDPSGAYDLLSSEENQITSVPHINDALADLGPGLMLDGELYYHGMDHSEIHSIVSRTANLHPDYHKMEYHIFDIVNCGEPQLYRTKVLQQIKEQLDGLSPIKVIKTYIAHNLEDVMQYYEIICDAGYEGIIVRNLTGLYETKRSTNIMKFKPKKDDWYTIVGWKEEHDQYGNPKGRMGALICTSDEGTHFSVGTGLTDKMRVTLWSMRDQLPGMYAHVQYQHISSAGRVPRFPVLVTVHDPNAGLANCPTCGDM